MLVFGRKKTPQDDVVVQHEARPGAKNRPTPKRRDQEAARVKPLVQTDRKAARAAEREQRRAATALQREAMITGEDKYLPIRDRGPVRRFIRDYVDARRNVGDYLLIVMFPIMIVVLVLSAFPSQARLAYALTSLVIYGLMGLAIIDCILMWRKIKTRVLETFGPDTPTKGLGWYAGMRAIQMRRMRMPKPQVSRGQYPL